MLHNLLLQAQNILLQNLWIVPLLVLLLLAVFTDLTQRKIPNLLIVAGLVVAFIGQLFLAGGQGWLAWLFGMLAGFAAFLPLYLLRGMAAGDVKLMATVGAFVGWGMAFQIALVSFVFGGVLGILVIVGKGRIVQAWHNICLIIMPLVTRRAGVNIGATDISSQSVGNLPYATAIALGSLTVLYNQYWY